MALFPWTGLPFFVSDVSNEMELSTSVSVLLTFLALASFVVERTIEI